MSGVKFFNNVTVDGSQTVTGIVSSVSAVFSQIQLVGTGGQSTLIQQGESNFNNLTASNITAGSIALTGTGNLNALSGNIISQYGDIKTESGRILSGGLDLFDIFAAGSPGDFGVRELSALDDVDVAGVVDGQILKYDASQQLWMNVDNAGALLSAGGFAVVSNKPRVNGDLTINGTLCALSGATFVNTTFTTTSSLCVYAELNTGAGLWVGANGTGDIASFYDTDQNVEVLHVGGANGTHPNVGVKTPEPNKDLTIKGEISASSNAWFGANIYANNQHLSSLYAAKGAADATTSVVNSGSALWNTAYSQLSSGNLSAAGVGFTANISLSTPSLSAAAGVFTGAVNAGTFYGDGSGLTNINAGNIQGFSGVTSVNGLTGTVTNVVFSTSANNFTDVNTFSQTAKFQAITATSGTFSGNILSAGQNLNSIFGGKASTDSAFTAVSNTSANWDTGYNISRTLSTGPALDGSKGYKFVSNNPAIYGDLTIYGRIEALSGSTFYNTTFTTTSSLCVVNTMNVDNAALYIGASGSGDIASFYDIDAGVEVLHVGGSTGSFPNVGIRTSAPNKTLTVSGDLSATGEIYASKILSAGQDLYQLFGTASSLTALADVSAVDVTNGQVLKYDSTLNRWTNQSDAQGAGATTALTDLTTDVSISTPQSGQALVYDSVDSKWKNSNLQIANVANLQTSLDGKQPAGTYSQPGHTHTFTDLTNFNVVSPTSGQSLVFDTADSKWKNITLQVANVANLQSTLDGKQAAGNYALSSHTHTTSDITNFTSSVNAAVFALTGTSIAPIVAGKIPATYVPLSVDDIVEVATLSALTANNFALSAMSNAMYVTTATNNIYRWSGSVYVEIAASPGSTSEIAEGTNLYFTNARAVQAVSAASNAGGLANQLVSPVMNGTATIGTSVFYARADHVHPSDTSRASLTSPSFAGIPTVPVPAAGDNTQQIAPTQWVRSNFLNSSNAVNNAGALSSISLAASTTVTAPSATFTSNISAARYLGSGSSLTGVVTGINGVAATGGNATNVVSTINGVAPVNGNFAGVAVTGSGNTFTGANIFSTSVSSAAISGTFFGNGANLTNLLMNTVTATTAGLSDGTWIARDSNRSWRSIAMSSDGTRQTVVVSGGQIYTSTDSGVTWIARDSNRSWFSVAMSSDGTRQTAVVFGGQIYTSTDSGVNWIARDSNRDWYSVAMSSDGTRQTAVIAPGQIYTSTDSGVTWTARDSNRNWHSVAMSSDGTRQTAVVRNGQIYTSIDSGVTWIARDSNRDWVSVAMSSDGTRQTAVARNGQIYTSTDSGVNWIARDSNRSWVSVAMSSDGTRQTAVVWNGQIYTSTDSGVNWIARDSNRDWISVAMSSDGTRQTAVVSGGQIYTSTQIGIPVVLFTAPLSAPALSGTFFGSGANLTNLPTAALPAAGTFSTSVSAPAVSGTHFGSGVNLTALNASNISSGTLGSSFLPAAGTFSTSVSSPSISAVNMFGNLVAPVTTQTATFTLSLANAGGIIRIAPPTAGSTVNINVPLNSTTAFPIGTQTIVAQVSAGTVSVSGAAGVTLLSYQSKTALAAQNSVASLIKTGTNEWLLAGDIN